MSNDKTKPTHHKLDGDKDDPWATANKMAERMSNDVYNSWRDELTNLLFFAALFSAILTSFTVEAGKAVQADPAEKTVILLQTLVLQVYNLSNPQANSNLPAIPNLTDPEVTISIAAQYVNLFYSVSLTLSLVAVLGGIVCLQWLREFSRNITGISHKHDLYLQYQRHESLRRWRVFSLLNWLPVLLLLALVLFFVGFVIAQWGTYAAVPVTALVGIAGLFIIVSSCLPALQVLWLADYTLPEFTIDDPTDSLPPPALCPYRSPQAWLFLSLLKTLGQAIQYIPINGLQPRRLTPFRDIKNWTDHDKWWTQKHHTPKSVYPAFFWLATEFKQSRNVVLDLYLCFLSAFGDTCKEYLPKLRDGVNMWQTVTVPEHVWNALGFPTLSRFDWDFINDSSIIVPEEAHRRLFTQVWMTLDTNYLEVDSSSVVYRFLRVRNYEDAENLLKDIAKALEDPSETWITDTSASAATCHVIDSQDIIRRLYRSTIPILIELSRRYEESGRFLPSIQKLCHKIQIQISPRHHTWQCCNMLIFIFNQVFPMVDASRIQTELGRLLVCCDNCYFTDGFATTDFLAIIERLSNKRLIGKRSSLNDIFLYTAHVIKRTWSPKEILPSIEKTLKAILSAAEDYVKLSKEEIDPLTPNPVLHPSQFFIDPLDSWDESVSLVIEDFNNSLKRIWAPYEAVGVDEVVATGMLVASNSGNENVNRNHTNTIDTKAGESSTRDDYDDRVVNTFSSREEAQLE